MLGNVHKDFAQFLFVHSTHHFAKVQAKWLPPTTPKKLVRLNYAPLPLDKPPFFGYTGWIQQKNQKF